MNHTAELETVCMCGIVLTDLDADGFALGTAELCGCNASSWNTRTINQIHNAKTWFIVASNSSEVSSQIWLDSLRAYLQSYC